MDDSAFLRGLWNWC